MRPWRLQRRLHRPGLLASRPRSRRHSFREVLSCPSSLAMARSRHPKYPARSPACPPNSTQSDPGRQRSAGGLVYRARPSSLAGGLMREEEERDARSLGYTSRSTPYNTPAPRTSCSGPASPSALRPRCTRPRVSPSFVSHLVPSVSTNHIHFLALTPRRPTAHQVKGYKSGTKHFGVPRHHERAYEERGGSPTG